MYHVSISSSTISQSVCLLVSYLSIICELRALHTRLTTTILFSITYHLLSICGVVFVNATQLGLLKYIFLLIFRHIKCG